MRLRHVYLLLCVAGFVLPYWQFIPWFREHGLNLSFFVHDLFANGVSGFFAMDVIVSAAVLFVLTYAEGRRLGMRLLWLPVAATVLVGVSLGLPLFLYFRQRHLDYTAA
jgi:hypothetical protein